MNRILCWALIRWADQIEGMPNYGVMKVMGGPLPTFPRGSYHVLGCYPIYQAALEAKQFIEGEGVML